MVGVRDDAGLYPLDVPSLGTLLASPADDIRAALGQTSQETSGFAPSVSHIAQILTDQGWEAATLSLDETPSFDVSGGGGRTITGKAMPFILAATGRADPADLALDPSVNIYR